MRSVVMRLSKRNVNILPTIKVVVPLMALIASCLTFANVSERIGENTPDQKQRIPTEDLVEGIESADGRWFDVEVIIFERTREKQIREAFDADVESKKPNSFWDIQASTLNPDISPLLTNLPLCHAEIDPLNKVVAPSNNINNFDVNANTDSNTDANIFFNDYLRYENIINNDWKVTNQLCLMPSETLSPYWALMKSTQEQKTSDYSFNKTNRSHYLVQSVFPELFTSVKYERFPKSPTGYDYDDYRGVYLLDEQNLKLKEQANKLDKNWTTKVLLHFGWRQPGLAPNKAVPVYIRAGQNFTDSFRYDGSPILDSQALFESLGLAHHQDPNNSAPTDANAQNQDGSLSGESLLIKAQRDNVTSFVTSLEKGAVIDNTSQSLIYPDRTNLPKETWQVDGSIKIILDHYLYFDADFNYREKQTKTYNVDQFVGNQNDILAKDSTNSLTLDSQNVLISAAKKDEQVSEFNEFNANPLSTDNQDAILEVEYLQNFPFKQLRRTYSGDLHYLDHPKFGVLFQIRKYRH